MSEKSAPSREARARDHEAFVRAHTSLARAPLCPEIALRLAREDTELWRATAEWLESREVSPPFWAFAWAGGQALARFVLDHPTEVRGKRVVDFGSGSGIVAIAAALGGATNVRACDVDELARAACQVNAEENRVRVTSLKELTGVEFDSETVLLVGDLFYDRTTADETSAAVGAARAKGARVLVGDPRRAYFPTKSCVLLATFEVPVPKGLESREVMTTDIFSFV